MNKAGWGLYSFWQQEQLQVNRLWRNRIHQTATRLHEIWTEKSYIQQISESHLLALSILTDFCGVWCNLHRLNLFPRCAGGLPRNTSWCCQDSFASSSEGRTDHLLRRHWLFQEGFKRGRLQGFVEGSWRYVVLTSACIPNIIVAHKPHRLVFFPLQLVCAGLLPSLVWHWWHMSFYNSGSTLTSEDSMFIYFLLLVFVMGDSCYKIHFCKCCNAQWPLLPLLLNYPVALQDLGPPPSLAFQSFLLLTWTTSEATAWLQPPLQEWRTNLASTFPNSNHPAWLPYTTQSPLPSQLRPSRGLNLHIVLPSFFLYLEPDT